ncbi:hypothetical protein [Pseudoalteromonas phage C7]|uniref:hypothetical protein n=1 Tax=Pseudoalteromonas phage C7 TaxID=2510494 RepID=UPI0010182EB8|nr:hypothetical protein PP587_gp58 [Pseudoalteromonas phage C7]QAY18012.1 hypothetical protein [Pseudoalteromonas phage C7]
MVTSIERQFIIDNPHLKSNAIQKFIDVSITHINRIKQEAHGKIKWFHKGNKYPYLNKGENGYRIRYAGNLILRTRNPNTAFYVIDIMISGIEQGYFDGDRIPKPKKFTRLSFELPSLMQIARKSDFKETARTYK